VGDGISRKASSDAYMNLQLINTEEFIDVQLAGFLGEVLIQCNNVLYIKAAEHQEEDNDDGGGDGGGADTANVVLSCGSKRNL
jgi:small nuclear ribonucleoprotein F